MIGKLVQEGLGDVRCFPDGHGVGRSFAGFAVLEWLRG